MRLAFVGDVMLGRNVNTVLTAAPPEYPWGDTRAVLAAADGVIANLECVIAGRGAPQAGKLFTFRADPAHVAVLRAGGVTAVSLANNHAMDYGPAALVECVGLLQAAGIAVAGAGRTAVDATRPARLVIAGRTIALFAFTDNEPEWEAGAATPGVSFAPVVEDPRFTRLLALVADARRTHDLVIVSAHWGSNWGRQPPASHPPAARALIDAGADIVHGHSAHVVRGIGVYRGRPIFYSCGDFIDDYGVDALARNDHSCVAVIDIDGRRPVRVAVVPTTIARCQARLAGGQDRRMIVRRLQRLCEALGTRAYPTADALEIDLEDAQPGAEAAPEPITRAS